MYCSCPRSLTPEMNLDERQSKVVERYELRAFPFTEGELDPLRNAEDAKLVSFNVDGWKHVASELGPIVERHARNRAPLLIVVDGASGTGRSSVVNYLAHLWVANRPEAAQPVVVRYTARTNNGEEALMRWAILIDRHVRAGGMRLTDATLARFDELPRQPPLLVPSKLGSILDSVVRELRNQSEATLIGVIEDVKDSTYLQVATAMLPGIDALVIMTVDTTRGNDQTVLRDAHTDIRDIDGKVISLRALTPHEGLVVVKERWACAAGATAPPWTEAGLLQAFGPEDRPLRDVIRLVGQVLILHTTASELTEIDDEKLSEMFETVEGTMNRR